MIKYSLVSIIITTKNEEKNIYNCLRSIKNQSYSPIEIIVVDNNSTDKTKEISKRYTNKIYNKGPERSAQRNFGVSKAKGEFILYLDADMILSPGVVQECIEKIQSDLSLIALYIPERIVSKPVTNFSKPIETYQTSYWIKVRDFERQFYNATVIDCVRFLRKDVFEIVQGFDETMSGPEDWDFDKKIRSVGKVRVITSPIYHNEGEFNMGRYLSKKAYYAQSFDKYISKWGKRDNDIKKQLGVTYRFGIVFIEDGKWKKLISSPMLTIAMYYLRFRVALRMLGVGFI